VGLFGGSGSGRSRGHTTEALDIASSVGDRNDTDGVGESRARLPAGHDDDDRIGFEYSVLDSDLKRVIQPVLNVVRPVWVFRCVVEYGKDSTVQVKLARDLRNNHYVYQ